MTNKEAIETIEANYPDERYTMLREALDMAIEALGEEPLRWNNTITECQEWNDWKYHVNAIKSVPSVPAVPLDKLCVLCEETSARVPCVLCDMIMPEWCKQNNNLPLSWDEEWKCPSWKQLLTKWMEEQDESN